jgi:hypothetical protein
MSLKIFILRMFCKTCHLSVSSKYGMVEMKTFFSMILMVVEGF